jgi:hypothetical protein
VTIGGTNLTSASTNGQYLTIPTNAVSGLKSMTLESWTDLGSGAPNPGRRIWDFGDPTHTSGQGWNFVSLAPYNGSASQVQAEFTLNGTSTTIGDGSAAISGYHHVVLSLDCTNGYADLYVDGVHHGHTITANQLTNANFKALWLGRSEWSGDEYLEGVIDELRIYDRPLSGIEAAANALAGPATINAAPATYLKKLLAVNLTVPTNNIIVTATNSDGTVAATATNLQEKSSMVVIPTADYAGPIGGGTNDAGVAVYSGLSLFSAAGLTLTSSDPTIASITPDGKIQGVKPGYVTITATYNSVSGSFGLNVTQDTTVPAIVGVGNKGYNTLLTVTFSKPVDPTTANVAANYSIDGVTVNSASLAADGTNLTLRTSVFGVNDVHTLTINNVQDTDFTPNVMHNVTGLIGPGAPIPYRYWPQGTNTGLVNSTAGTDSMTNFPGYPNTGGQVVMLTSGLTTSYNPGNNYYFSCAGWFWPTNDATYTFGLADDDDALLYVSTDETAAHLPAVATIELNGWRPAKDYASGGAATTRYNGTTNGVPSIPMLAGHRYYFKLVAVQGGGGYNMDVAWTTDGTIPTNGQANIAAQFVQPFIPAPFALTITNQPSNLLIAQGLDATFTVGVDSQPAYVGLQWYLTTTNNVTTAIAGGTNLSLTQSLVTTNNSGQKYYAIISNLVDTVTSSIVTMTVNNDTTQPRLLRAEPDLAIGATNITLTFDKRLSAASIANSGFTVTGMTIGSVVFNTNTLTNVTVTLTAPLVASNSYTMTVKSGKTYVKDLSGNIMDPAHNTFVFHGPQLAVPGAFLFHTWDSYNTIDSIMTYSATTAYSRILSYALMDSGALDQPEMTAISEGLIQAPEDGNYTFFTDTDDQCRLFISSDSTPDNLPATAIATVTGWCNGRNLWTTDTNVNVNGGANELSLPITMVKGNRYYYRVLWENYGQGGSFCQIAWTTPSSGTNFSVVPGSVLVSPASIDFSSVSITTNPVSQTTVEGVPVTFSVSAVGSSQYGSAVGYQWYKNGVAIPQANAASYTTPLLTPLFGDSGSTYQVVTTVPLKAATSTVATLTVTKAPAPVVLSAGVTNGSMTVGVRFSQVVDPTTATTAANYSISDHNVAITGVTLRTNAVLDGINGDMVVLAVDTPITDETLSLTVTGVKGYFGSAVPTATVPITIAPLTLSDIGAPLFAGVFEPSGSNSFRIQGGGADIWGTGDQFAYAYLQTNGDFDVKARIANLSLADNWSKAGLIVRGTLATNSTMFYMVVTPAAGQNVWSSGERQTNELGCDNPPHPAGVSNDIAGPTYPNAWVRITRFGNAISGWYSTNGVTWVRQGTNNASLYSPAMTGEVYIGVGLTAHNNGANYYSTADVYDFSILPYTEAAVVRPNVTATSTPSGVVLSWNSSASPGFKVFSSATVDGSFADAGLTVTDNGTTASVTIPAAASKMFYELKN